MASRAKYSYRPITVEEFEAGLEEANLTRAEWCRITGASARRLQRWSVGEEVGPPAWAGALLVAMTVPEARQLVMTYTDWSVLQVEEVEESELPLA